MNDRDKDLDTAVKPDRTLQEGASLGSSSAIGRRLKAYYDDVAGEPVPDKFLSLLDALDAAESKSRSQG